MNASTYAANILAGANGHVAGAQLDDGQEGGVGREFRATTMATCLQSLAGHGCAQ
jgi:hypothetical protein